MADEQPTGDVQIIEQPVTGEETIEQLSADRDRWKKHARTHEDMWKATGAAPAELRDLIKARDKLHQLEEAQKTAEQKAADKAAVLEKERTQAVTEAARLRVALRKGLTEIQAKRLVGDSEEELEADADDLIASFSRSDTSDASEKQESSTRPKEKLKSGSVKETDGPSQLTREDLKTMTSDEIVKADQEGRLRDLKRGGSTNTRKE